MDKISSIISSSRNHVDMSKERPVRAGAPSYGQPVSQATHTFQKAEQEESPMTTRSEGAFEKVTSPDALRHSGIVDKITLSFKGHDGQPQEAVLELEPENVPMSSHSQGEGQQPEGLDLYA